MLHFYQNSQIMNICRGMVYFSKNTKETQMISEDDIHKQIERITKMSLEDRSFLLRIYSRAPLVIQVAMENRKKKTFHMLREKFSDCDNEILAYCSHILSIKTYYSRMKNFSKKMFDDMSLNEIRDASMIEIKKDDEKEYLRKSPKRQKVLHYWSVVKMMREHKPKPISFEKIAMHLSKKFNFSVRHNLIAEMWREIENV